jgi:AcrR family transcriptional regulator
MGSDLFLSGFSEGFTKCSWGVARLTRTAREVCQSCALAHYGDVTRLRSGPGKRSDYSRTVVRILWYGRTGLLDEVERSQTPKGQRARVRILRAAEDLFVDRGFHGASIRDIATAADLPLATLVYHFARKEQLYAALLHDIGGRLIARLDAAIVEGGSKIEAFVNALVQWAGEQPGRVKLLLRELLDNPTRVRKAQQLPLAPFLERAAALIEEGRRTGQVNVGSAEVAVLHLVGAVSYVVAAWPTVDRIVGAERARRIHGSYEREAIAFAKRALGFEETAHGSRPTSSARSSRARSPRA